MSRFARRAFLAACTFIVGALGLPSQTLAQPARTVRILVGFPAGGGTDAIARLLSEKLKD